MFVNRLAAASAFRDSVHEVIDRAEFGLTPHPAFSRRHAEFLARLGDELDTLWAGDARVADWKRRLAGLLAEAKRLPIEAKKGMSDDVVRRTFEVHACHASLAYAWVSAWPETLAATIDDVRFAWGKRASNVDDGGSEGIGGGLFRPGGGWTSALMGLYEAAKAIERSYSGMHLDKIEDLTIAHFDFPEDPRVKSATPDEIVFGCAGCGADLTRPVNRAGLPDRCSCSLPLVIPVPSLQRVLAAARKRSDDARGIMRCRVCNAVVQRRKGPTEWAGFCSRLCARDGMDRFGEWIPESGRADGDQVVFGCRCGTDVMAPAADRGSQVACPTCELTIWIPPVAVQRAMPVLCAKCGKKSKAGVRICQWCSSPVGD